LLSLPFRKLSPSLPVRPEEQVPAALGERRGLARQGAPNDIISLVRCLAGAQGGILMGRITVNVSLVARCSMKGMSRRRNGAALLAALLLLASLPASGQAAARHLRAQGSGVPPALGRGPGATGPPAAFAGGGPQLVFQLRGSRQGGG
jgi:hypothetical protein